jgi:hypothetical protein
LELLILLVASLTLIFCVFFRVRRPTIASDAPEATRAFVLALTRLHVTIVIIVVERLCDAIRSFAVHEVFIVHNRHRTSAWISSLQDPLLVLIIHRVDKGGPR